MKQILIRKGRPVVADVPPPAAERGRVVVLTSHSMISSGTEATIIEQSGRNLAARAMDRPDLVRQTLESVRQQGLSRTVSKVVGRLSAGVAVGYSCAGTVLEVGSDVADVHPGDRVACAGGGYATHAEIVSVPKNLVVPVPQGCSMAHASSVTLGAIALQGIRRAEARLGDVVIVLGLGLLGQLSVQILKASGCRVIGVDVDERRLTLARELGAEMVLDGRDPAVVQSVLHASGQHGADAVVITASSSGNEVVQQAMLMTRKKGRVVVVGSVGLDVQRSPFYEKEIDLLISCSYGPGRYDEKYEVGGVDYPYAYVRWTENRNMQEYLRLVASGSVRLDSLIAGEFSIDEAPVAYEFLRDESRPLAAVIHYEAGAEARETRKKNPAARTQISRPGVLRVAVVGPGAFAKAMHLPNLTAQKDVALAAIVSGTGNNATAVAQQFAAAYATTRYEDVLDDPSVDAVVIATRHHLHADQIVAALERGKHVYCEKPLALTEEDIDRVMAVARSASSILTVGFNRRFSPAAVLARAAIAEHSTPAMVLYRVNAGYASPDSWVHGAEGGGRIIGEGCHMLDLFEYLLEAEPVSVTAEAMHAASPHLLADDNFSCAIRFSTGAVAQLFYTALGPKEVPKELVQIFADGQCVEIDDFRQLAVKGAKRKGWKGAVPDKGHRQALQAFVEATRTGLPPIAYDSLERTSRLAVQLAAMVSGRAS